MHTPRRSRRRLTLGSEQRGVQVIARCGGLLQEVVHRASQLLGRLGQLLLPLWVHGSWAALLQSADAGESGVTPAAPVAVVRVAAGETALLFAPHGWLNWPSDGAESSPQAAAGPAASGQQARKC